MFLSRYGSHFSIWTSSYQHRNYHYKIPFSQDCLIFMMGIIIASKTIFVMKQGPNYHQQVSHLPSWHATMVFSAQLLPPLMPSIIQPLYMDKWILNTNIMHHVCRHHSMIITQQCLARTRLLEFQNSKRAPLPFAKTFSDLQNDYLNCEDNKSQNCVHYWTCWWPGPFVWWNMCRYDDGQI